MEVTVNTLSDVLHEAEILVTDTELQPHFEKAYHEYRPKVEIRGFRKGKVPLDMIKRLYGEAIEHEALDTVANAFYERAMSDRNIHPVGQPSMVEMDFKRGEHFRFKIKYEVRPEVQLKKYKGLSVEKQIHKVTDAEVEHELDHLRRINSTTAEVQSVTDTDHIVTADLQEFDQAGTPLIGKKSTNARIDLSDTSLVKEIRDALMSAETGGTYRARFESQHGDHTHPVDLAITVSKIEKVTLPALDDEFVTKVTKGKTATYEEFLTNLQADLEKYWEDQAERHLADAIAAQIVDAHNFSVPDAMVKALLDSFIEDIRGRSRERQLPKDFDDAKFREENRAYAVRQAKWMLLKERIAEEEHISVTDEEIERLAETDAAKIGLQKEQLLNYYKSSSGATDRLLSEKITAFLKSHAKIKERIVEEPPPER